MKVRRYGPIHQLTFYAPVLPINVQLFEHELGLVLIDTALERNATDILSYIAELDKPLLAILLTHAHGDHVGGVDTIKAEHPLAELFISRRDARLLSGRSVARRRRRAEQDSWFFADDSFYTGCSTRYW